MNRDCGALIIPKGTYHRSTSSIHGSIVINQAVRDKDFDHTTEFVPVMLDRIHYCIVYLTNTNLLFITNTSISKMQTYHIYLNDKCLFKNLDQHEFDVIWNKLYTSYWKEEITYSCITDNTKDYVSTLEESSY